MINRKGCGVFDIVVPRAHLLLRGKESMICMMRESCRALLSLSETKDKKRKICIPRRAV